MSWRPDVPDVKVLFGGIDVRVTFSEEPAPTEIPPVEDPSQLAELLQVLDRLVPAGATAAVVLPTWGPPRQRETYDVARALLDGRSLLVVETALPPVAASLAASILTALAPRLGDAHVVALALPQVEREMVALAWLSSVTGLGRLDVPLGLHARSYLSRRGFVVRAHPRPGIARAVRKPGPLELELPRAARAVLATQDGDDDWRERALGPVLSGVPSMTILPPDASATWWGCRRFVEVAVGPGDFDDLARRARAAVDLTTCRWCGSTTAASRSCPRCGAGAPDGEPAGVRKATP